MIAPSGDLRLQRDIMQTQPQALAQAEMAAQQQNWSLLSQCLRQALQGEDAPEALVTEHLETTLNWALQVLAFGDFQARWDIVKVLPRFGTAAIAPLVAILQDEETDEELLWFTARLLGEFKQPTVVKVLVDLLRHWDKPDQPEVAQAAALALGHVGSMAIAPLISLLAQASTRLVAVQALAQIDSPKILDPLLTVIRDTQAEVRVSAIEALAAWPDPRLPPILLQALADPAAPVRCAAVRGLGYHPGTLNREDLVAQLCPLLWDVNLAVCEQTAIALGRLGTAAAMTALAKVLQQMTTPESLALGVIQALGAMETPAALDSLAQALLSHENPHLCAEVINTLGRCRSQISRRQASQVLRTALTSQRPVLQQPYLVQMLALNLGELQDFQALKLLEELAVSPDDGVQLHGIAALKKLERGFEALGGKMAEAQTEQWDP